MTLEFALTPEVAAPTPVHLKCLKLYGPGIGREECQRELSVRWRDARGKLNRQTKEVIAHLGAQVVRRLIHRSLIEAQAVETVVMANPSKIADVQEVEPTVVADE